MASRHSTCVVAPTITAIHGLPAEILLSIFLRISTDDSRQLTPAIVAASQVCSRWRAVALSHGQCWTAVDICARRWAALFLRRAGNLDLALVARGRVADAQLELVLPHLARARSFALCGAGEGKGGDARPELLERLRSMAAMPRLVSLQLDGQPQYDYHADAPPSLRRLALRDGCYISSSFPMLRADLVRLELARCIPAEAGADVVHSILRGLPGLQHLVLHYAQKLDAPPVGTPTQPAALHNLQTLDIRDTPAALAHRLSLLQLPHTTQISAASDDALTIPALGSVAALARALHAHAPSTTHALSVFAPAPGTCAGRVALAWQGCSLALATGAGCAPLPCVLRKLLCAAPTSVRALEVSHGHFFAPSAWTDLHSLAPAVERIAVAGQAGVANALLQALLAGAYPALREVALTDVALGGRAGVDVLALAAVRAARPALDVRVQGCTLRAEMSAAVRGALVCCDARPGHAFRWSGPLGARGH